MVRECGSAKGKPARKRHAGLQTGSVQDTPHLKEVLSRPVGTPIELRIRQESGALGSPERDA